MSSKTPDRDYKNMRERTEFKMFDLSGALEDMQNPDNAGDNVRGQGEC